MEYALMSLPHESSGISTTIAAAISSMAARPDDPTVAGSGCAALVTIAEDGVLCAQAVTVAGGSVAAVTAMLGHPSVVRVQATGAAALGAIAAGGAPCAQVRKMLL
tara:strand:+ start:190 stop:507 length:318 start_codon:yes stop_codon:yes gene_type:complete